MVARTGKGESIGDGPGAAGMGLFVPINRINCAGGVLGLEEFEGGALDAAGRELVLLDEVCERASAFGQDLCPALISSWVVTGPHVALRCVLTQS